jgi:hypothetical protein
VTLKSIGASIGTTFSFGVLLLLALPATAVLTGCDGNECDDDRPTVEALVEFEGTEGVTAICEIARAVPCARESEIVTAVVPDAANLGPVQEANVSCVGQTEQGTLRLRMMIRGEDGEFREYDSAETTAPGVEIVVGVP